MISPQPLSGKGLKYIDCPCYGDCLTHAAKRNWRAWTCDQCPNLGLEAVYRTMKFIGPYYRLMAEIYPEFKRRCEPVVTSLNLEV